MFHRLPTRATLLALACVAIVVSHDVVMASNPHAVDHRAVAHDNGHPHQVGHADDSATHPKHGPTGVHCTSLVAARTVTVSVEGPDTATLGVLPASLVIAVDACRAVPTRPGVPPDRTRALLQVWLI